MLCQYKATAIKRQRGLQPAMASATRALRAAGKIPCTWHRMCILAGRKRKELCIVLTAQLRLRQAVRRQVKPVAFPLQAKRRLLGKYWHMAEWLQSCVPLCLVQKPYRSMLLLCRGPDCKDG